MNTDTKPRQSTDEEVRTDLRPGDADEPMKAHRVCRQCFPGKPMGAVALCGEKILGIPTPKWYFLFGKYKCKKCTMRAAARHLRDVHGGSPS